MDPKLAQRLNDDFRKALQTPEVVAQLRSSGYEPVASSIADFKKFIDQKSSNGQRVQKLLGLNLNSY